MRFAADAVIYVHLWDFVCRHMITEYLLGNSVVAHTCHNGEIHGLPSIATSLDSDQTPWRRSSPTRQRPPRSGLVQTPMSPEMILESRKIAESLIDGD